MGSIESFSAASADLTIEESVSASAMQTCRGDVFSYCGRCIAKGLGYWIKCSISAMVVYRDVTESENVIQIRTGKAL